MDAYRDWVTGAPHDLVVLPFVSMHGSTRQLVDHLVSSLVKHGVRVELFNLAVTDIGKLAMPLVDALTVFKPGKELEATVRINDVIHLPGRA